MDVKNILYNRIAHIFYIHLELIDFLCDKSKKVRKNRTKQI